MRRIEARIGALTSDVSDITDNVSSLTETISAHGALLDAAHKLVQDVVDRDGHTHGLMQDMNGTIGHMGGDIAVLKLDFEAMKVDLNAEVRKREDDRRILMEIRDLLLARPQQV